MKKLYLVMILTMAILAAVPAAGEDYRYVKAEQLREWLQTGKRMIVVDIRDPAEFERQHFRGSLGTGAYPVKSDADRGKLEGAVKTALSSSDDIVIVCPRGGGGAKNSYDHLKKRGLEEKRLYILEKGMEGWPYPELTVRK